MFVYNIFLSTFSFVQAESEEVKHMWVKEIRNLTQQFQFGLLQPRGKSLNNFFFKNILNLSFGSTNKNF